MTAHRVPFALHLWRRRLRLTQAEAAQALGLSLSTYRAQEYEAQDRQACRTTVALLAQLLERVERSEST